MDSIDFHWFPWIPMDFNGFHGFQLNSHSYSRRCPWISHFYYRRCPWEWESMDFNGFQWIPLISMDFNGFPWIPMVFWISLFLPPTAQRCGKSAQRRFAVAQLLWSRCAPWGRQKRPKVHVKMHFFDFWRGLFQKRISKSKMGRRRWHHPIEGRKRHPIQRLPSAGVSILPPFNPDYPQKSKFDRFKPLFKLKTFFSLQRGEPWMGYFVLGASWPRAHKSETLRRIVTASCLYPLLRRISLWMTTCGCWFAVWWKEYSWTLVQWKQLRIHYCDCLETHFWSIAVVFVTFVSSLEWVFTWELCLDRFSLLQLKALFSTRYPLHSCDERKEFYFARRLLGARVGRSSFFGQTWLILPVVICLSQRLSHACLSISFYTAKLRMAH